jgi:hypothetical protein
MIWKECKNEFPCIYDFVLVCTKNKGTNEPKPISIARIDANNQWEFCNEEPCMPCYGAYMDIEYPMNIDEITHWMPLPNPPKD